MCWWCSWVEIWQRNHSLNNFTELERDQAQTIPCVTVGMIRLGWTWRLRIPSAVCSYGQCLSLPWTYSSECREEQGCCEYKFFNSSQLIRISFLPYAIIASCSYQLIILNRNATHRKHLNNHHQHFEWIYPPPFQAQANLSGPEQISADSTPLGRFIFGQTAV